MSVDPCFAALLAEPQAPLHSIENLTAPGPAGPLQLRLYRPTNDRSLPLVLFMHGGGFVLGDPDTHDSICSAIAHHANGVGCAVDYRRAPEARFPAPIDDGAAALEWLLANAPACARPPACIRPGAAQPALAYFFLAAFFALVVASAFDVDLRSAAWARL